MKYRNAMGILIVALMAAVLWPGAGPAAALAGHRHFDKPEWHVAMDYPSGWTARMVGETLQFSRLTGTSALVFVLAHDKAYLDPTLSMDDIFADILSKAGAQMAFQTQPAPSRTISGAPARVATFAAVGTLLPAAGGYVYQFSVGSDGFGALASVPPGSWQLHQADFDVILNSIVVSPSGTPSAPKPAPKATPANSGAVAPPPQ